jgi:hypothetical protein
MPGVFDGSGRDVLSCSMVRSVVKFITLHPFHPFEMFILVLKSNISHILKGNRQPKRKLFLLPYIS